MARRLSQPRTQPHDDHMFIPPKGGEVYIHGFSIAAPTHALDSEPDSATDEELAELRRMSTDLQSVSDDELAAAVGRIAFALRDEVADEHTPS